VRFRAGRLSGDTDPRRAGQRVLRLSRRLSLHPAGLYHDPDFGFTLQREALVVLAESKVAACPIEDGAVPARAETDLVVPGIFRTANAFATAPGGNRTVLDWTSGYFDAETILTLALHCNARRL
jgi:hypothetical protein